MKLISNKTFTIITALIITACCGFYFYLNQDRNDQPKENANVETSDESDNAEVEKAEISDVQSDDGQVPLKFSYTSGGEEKTYISESITCLDYKLPEAMYYDFNNDGVNEILVQCYAGSGSAENGVYHIGGSTFYAYFLSNDKLTQIADLWNERGFEWKVEDFNNDGYLDIRVGDFFDCDNDKTHELCKSGESWTVAPKTYLWDNSINNFTINKN